MKTKTERKRLHFGDWPHLTPVFFFSLRDPASVGFKEIPPIDLHVAVISNGCVQMKKKLNKTHLKTTSSVHFFCFMNLNRFEIQTIKF